MKLRMYSSASDCDVLVVGGRELRRRSGGSEPVAVQFRLREAEPGDAIGFGEKRRQSSFDAPFRDQCAQRRRLGRAHENAAARFRIEKRRIRLLPQLSEAERRAGR